MVGPARTAAHQPLRRLEAVQRTAVVKLRNTAFGIGTNRPYLLVLLALRQRQ
jgi:hypothetical protein